MLKAIASIAKSDTGPTARLRRSPRWLDARYLSLLSAVATYGLIVLGGTVRATDPGLACPDWPRCHGQLVPPLEYHVLIEYSHRLAAVGVGLLIASTALAVWLWQRDNRALVFGVSAAVLLLIVQVLVGGATVNMELSATIVATHLSLALALLATLVFTTVVAIASFDAERFVRLREPPSPDSNGPLLTPTARVGAPHLLLLLAAAATFALIIVGSYVANSGASLVYPDWPLFDGQLTSAGGRLADLHYAHRLMAVVVGVVLLAAALAVWRWGRPAGRRRALLIALGLAFVLYVAQVLVGASNIWLELATSVRIVHLALAAALWATLAFAVVWSYLERGAERE